MCEIYQNGTYIEKNPTWHVEDSPWKAKQIIKIMNRNNLYPKTICEIGCGAGGILSQLSELLDENIMFSGYEISPQAYELSKNRKRKNLSFYLKDLLDEKDKFFDVVMAIDVLEHIEDYFGFLRKIKTMSNYKILHIPLDISVQSVIRANRLLKDRIDVGHIHYFTKETALATLKDTGYKVIDYFYTASSIELPNRGLKANMLKIPRKLLFRTNKDVAARLFGGFSLMVLAE